MSMSQKGSSLNGGDAIEPARDVDTSSLDARSAEKPEQADDSGEIFKRQEGAVDFRTVSWVHASVIFLKRTSPIPDAPAANASY